MKSDVHESFKNQYLPAVSIEPALNSRQALALPTTSMASFRGCSTRNLLEARLFLDFFPSIVVGGTHAGGHYTRYIFSACRVHVEYLRVCRAPASFPSHSKLAKSTTSLPRVPGLEVDSPRLASTRESWASGASLVAILLYRTLLDEVCFAAVQICTHHLYLLLPLKALCHTFSEVLKFQQFLPSIGMY